MAALVHFTLAARSANTGVAHNIILMSAIHWNSPMGGAIWVHTSGLMAFPCAAFKITDSIASDISNLI